jgi:threonyl-tRNA synthetase
MNENKVAVRRQGKGDLGTKEVEVFLQEVIAEISDRRAE